ncbi:metallophosphoesterase [Devosia oryziradicis]|uniref:Metallophosphoesterase n=1 Tax=Devosia oryziradicis TaxID=2801335 RepID=A0ABX7C038_9HYPH|nr:metallophosphoesterase [Devosia oryziradicis]QQR37582.1 metallophosphoesterase [Devosia oryziradicis]
MIVGQLSDIHADGSAEALQRLDVVLGWLGPLRPDAVIVSGDLAESDHQRSYRAVRQRLENLGAPFFVVPGNMDDHGLMMEAFGDLYGWSSPRPLNVVGSLRDLRLIGLDVTVSGAHHGDARPVLDWLSRELNSDDPPALIFQHQHPFKTGIDGKDRNICFGGDELARVIENARSPVIALTCGHVHRPMFTRFAERPATMAPSVARANRLRLDGRESNISDPPGLLVHHWSEGRLVSHAVAVH